MGINEKRAAGAARNPETNSALLSYSVNEFEATKVASFFRGGIRNTLAGGVLDLDGLFDFHAEHAELSASARQSLAAGDVQQYNELKSQHGYFTPAIFRGGVRAKENVIAAGCIAVDIDLKDGCQLPTDVLDEAVRGLPPAYFGRSGRGFRLIYVFDHPLTGADLHPRFKATFDRIADYFASYDIAIDSALAKPEQPVYAWADDCGQWDFDAPPLTPAPAPVSQTPAPSGRSVSAINVSQITLSDAHCETIYRAFEDAQNISVLGEQSDAGEQLRFKLFSGLGRAFDWSAAGAELAAAIGILARPTNPDAARSAREKYYRGLSAKARGREINGYGYTAVKEVAAICGASLATTVTQTQPAVPAITTLATYAGFKRVDVAVDRYIAERIDTIEGVIAAHKHTLIQAPTGCGKTHSIIDYCVRYSMGYDNGYCALIVVPRARLADEFFDRAQNSMLLGHAVGYVRESVSSLDIEQMYRGETRVFVSTADGLQKVKVAGLLPKLLCIDEAHDLLEAVSYRSGAVGLLEDLLQLMATQSDTKIISMTATPTDPLIAALGADCVVKINRRQGPEYHVTPVAGSANEVLEFVVSTARKYRAGGIVYVDAKFDRSNACVSAIAAGLRRLGYEAHTATKDSFEGLGTFTSSIAAGRDAILVATNIAAMGYDVPATGQNCWVIHVAKQQGGIKADMAIQTAGRFRDAASVHTYIYASDSLLRGRGEHDARRVDRVLLSHAESIKRRRQLEQAHVTAPAGRLVYAREQTDDLQPRLLAIAAKKANDVRIFGGWAAAAAQIEAWYGRGSVDMEVKSAAELIFDDNRMAPFITRLFYDLATDVWNAQETEWRLRFAQTQVASKRKGASVRFGAPLDADLAPAILQALLDRVEHAVKRYKKVKDPNSKRAKGIYTAICKDDVLLRYLMESDNCSQLWKAWVDSNLRLFAAITNLVNVLPKRCNLADAIRLYERAGSKVHEIEAERRGLILNLYDVGGLRESEYERYFRLESVEFHRLALLIKTRLPEIIDLQAQRHADAVKLANADSVNVTGESNVEPFRGFALREIADMVADITGVKFPGRRGAGEALRLLESVARVSRIKVKVIEPSAITGEHETINRTFYQIKSVRELADFADIITVADAQQTVAAIRSAKPVNRRGWTPPRQPNVSARPNGPPA